MIYLLHLVILHYFGCTKHNKTVWLDCLMSPTEFSQFTLSL